jgi:hypothetical protein
MKADVESVTEAKEILRVVEESLEGEQMMSNS